MDLCTDCKYDSTHKCKKHVKDWPKKLGDVCHLKKAKTEETKPKIRYIRDDSIYLKLYL